MRATLQFRLPEEEEEHQTALDGWRWKLVVDRMCQFLRSRLKYEDPTPTEREVLEDIRKELNDLIDDQGLFLP